MLTTLTTLGFFAAFATIFQRYLNRLIEADRAALYSSPVNPEHPPIAGDDYDFAGSSFH